MPLGQAFSNFGLVSEGMDAATRQRNAIRSEDQASRDSEQNAVLRGQRVQEGAMGLEEVTRQRANAADARTAAASGRTMHESLDNIAKMYQSKGMLNEANAALDAKKKLIDEGVADGLHAIMVNPNKTGVRFDVADAVNAKGAHQMYVNKSDENDPNNPTWDGKGTLTYTDAKTGKRQPVDAAKVGTLLGVFKQNEVTMQPDTTRITSNPLSGKTDIYTAPGKTEKFGPDKYIHEQKNEDGSTTLIDIDPKSKNYSKPITGDAAAPRPSPNIDKHLPALKEVSHAISQLPGMSTTDPADLTGATKVLTPDGQKRMALASQIYMANRNIDARTIALMATKGETGKNASGEFVLRYNGQDFKLASPQGQTPPAAAPAAKPDRSNFENGIYRSKNPAVRAATEERLARERAEAGEAPAPAGDGAAAEAKPAKAPVSSAAAERAVEKGRTATAKFDSNTPAIKLPGKASKVDDVRAALKKTNPNVADKMLLESYKDSKELSKEERAKIQEIIGTGYSRGGKVSRQGLGA